MQQQSAEVHQEKDDAEQRNIEEQKDEDQLEQPERRDNGQIFEEMAHEEEKIERVMNPVVEVRRAMEPENDEQPLVAV